MKPSLQFIKRDDGVRIAYSQFGRGQPLVCPSPWVTSLSYIFEDPFAKQFWGSLAEGVKVISYDKHGCGQSDRNRKEFTLESELLDLETVTGHLELDEFSLLASSMAGPVSMQFTSRYPKRVRRLILFGTYAKGEDLAKEEFKSALISLVRASWGLGSKALADIFHPEANAEELQSLAKFQRDSANPEIAAKLLALSFSLDVSQFLSDINTPTLILHREGDKVVPIDHGRRLAMEIPNAQFKVLKGRIHPCWYGETNQIIEEILEFIGRSESRAPPRDESDGTNKKDGPRKLDDLPTDEADIAEQATIVFTDIVSSTDFVTQVGDAAARNFFLKHDKIIRNQLEKYGGRELQNLGDGFMLSFTSASGAIECACRIQQKISKSLPSIEVRIGINTGEVVRREGKHPFGQAVVMASRIVSKCKGGQILVSEVTKHLTAGGVFSFVEKGRFKPKGFDGSTKLYEVAWSK